MRVMVSLSVGVVEARCSKIRWEQGGEKRKVGGGSDGGHSFEGGAKGVAGEVAERQVRDWSVAGMGGSLLYASIDRRAGR